MANSSFPLYLRPQYEAGSAASQFSRDIDALAQKSEAQFRQSFGNISQTIQQALSVPRNVGGSLDLGSGQYQQAAKEARLLATASREVATAASLAAREGGKTRSDLRLFATDANNAAREANQYATQLERVALVNDRVQAELNKTKSATDAVVAATNRGTTAFGAVTNSTRAMRQATTQAGQQLQDIAISIGSGQRASTVFAQQLPQLAFAFSGVTGAAGSMAAKVGSVATFLSGPWGVLVAIGAFALSPLIDGLFKTEKASDSAKAKTYDFADGLDIMKLSAQEAGNALEQLVQQTAALIEKQGDLIAQNGAIANSSVASTQSQLSSVDAQIAQQKKLIEQYDKVDGYNTVTSYLDAGAYIRAYELNQLLEQRKIIFDSLTNAKKAQANVDIATSQRAVAESRDPSVKAKNDYDRAAGNLYKRRQRGIQIEQTGGIFEGDEFKQNGYSKAAYERDKKALDDKYEAEKKIFDQRNRNKASSGSNPSGVLTRFISPVDGRITSIPGIRRDPITGKTASHAGLDIAAPNGTPVRAPAGGVIIETGNISGYGKVVFIDHGAGTITRLAHLSNNSQVKVGQVVSQGEVVGNVGSTGHSTGNHLHQEVRLNGRIADPRTGRFPTDSLGAQSGVEEAQQRALEAATQAAQQLQNELDGISVAVTRIGGEFDRQPRFIDRATLAAEQLRLIIGDIDKQLAGKDLSAEQRAKLEIDKVNAGTAQNNAKNAVSNDFNKETEAFNKRLEIQKLILAGRTDEANIAERLGILSEKYGTDDRLLSLREELKVASEILAAEDSTQAEREAATATIKKTSTEYNDLSKTIERIRRETTAQYSQEKAINEAIEKRNESIARYQSVVSGTYGALEDLLSGGSGGDFLKSIKDQFEKLRGANLAESLFGDAFRDLKKFTERNNPENVAVRNLVEQIDTGSTAVYDFASAVVDATNRITGAANDNGANILPASQGGPASNSAIVVTAQISKSIRDGNRYNFGQFTTQIARGIINPLLAKLDQSFGTGFFSQMSGVLSGALAGYARAGKVGAVLGGAQGIAESLSKSAKSGSKSAEAFGKIGAQLGAALGGAQTGDQTALLLRSVGVKTSRTGGQIGGAIGQASGIPGGEIAGSIIGSIVGGFFKKTKTGKVVLSSATDQFTTSGKLGSQLSGAGSSVQDSLKRISDQLGGTLGAFSVSIGKRGDNFRVSGDGATNVDTKKTKNIKGLIYDGKDEAEAVRIALLNAIQDGAIKGLRQGAQRLLQAGKDLEVQVQKALDFESVFTRLKAYKDPVGAALDTLDKEFVRLKTIFDEAGASVQERAQLEELYGIERSNAIKEAQDRIVGSLRDLYNELTVGNDARSLSERLGYAQKNYDPLAARVASGDTAAYDEFTAAARELLDIQRQFSGSQTGYFDLLNQVTGLSRTALGSSDSINFASVNRDSPFTTTGSVANDNGAAVVGAIGAQTNLLLAGMNQTNLYLQQIALQGGYATAGGFSLSGATYF
jgi:murein DD-endopeptidase MepM/ murein hydrolase activator NlpD